MPIVLHLYERSIDPATPAQLALLRRHRPGDRLVRVGGGGERADLPEPDHALHCPLGYLPAAGPGLRRLMDQRQATLVHAWSLPAAGPAAGVAGPMLVSVSAPPGRALAGELRHALRAGAHLLVPSRTLALHLARLGVPPERVHVSAPAADGGPADASSRRQARRALGLDDEDWVVAAPPQRLTGSGLVLAVWVTDVLRHATGRCRLVIPGAAPAVANARRMAQTSGSMDLLRLPGPGGEATALAAADAVLLPDPSGLGLAWLAMAVQAGVAVVAARAGELGEAVLDGQTGLLAEPQPRRLSQALWRLYRDRPLADRLARSAQQHWGDTFSPSAALARLENLYARLASGPAV